MLICREEKCSCLHHRILNCFKKGMNLEAKLFLDKIKNISEMRDNSGLTLLHYSVECGNAEMSQHLLDRGCKVDAQDDNGVTPLMMAVKAKDKKTVEILFKENADIYITGGEGQNNFELAFISRFYSPPQAILTKDSQIILDMLIEKITDGLWKERFLEFLSNVNDFGKLAIVVFGSVEVSKFTLDNGYSIDFQEPKRNRTALHCAIALIKFETARLLIKHGANVNALDDSNYAPLHFYTGDFEAVDENYEVLKSLLRQSTNLSSIDCKGLTDVERLVMLSRKEETVRVILQTVIDVDVYVDKDSSLLHRLVVNRNLRNLDFLTHMNYTFDVNKKDAMNHTPLTKAALHGSPEKVEFLLRHGADINLIESNGHTIVYSTLLYLSNVNVEKDKCAAKVIELLLHSGVDVELFYKDKPYLLNWVSFSTKVVVAHWAMAWTFDHSSLSEQSRGILKSRSELKNYFNACIVLLTEMKLFKVYDTVTLHELLIDREEKLIASYADNQEFISSFNSAMENLSGSETYYVNTLRRRLAKMIG